jgi:hypothetical protein
MVILSDSTTLAITRECYETHVGLFTPTGSLTQQGLTRLPNCGGGDGLGTGDIYATYSACIGATAAVLPLAEAVLDCCRRPAFSGMVSTDHYVGGTEVNCPAIIAANPLP